MEASRTITATPVRLYLEKGAVFEGRGYGDFSQPRHGEFVFCTAMSGIEESLTDPSFARQVLVTTVAHVGNTGYTADDCEAQKIWAEGLISRHLETEPSNWRARSSLPEWIVSQGRFAVDGIDTRALTILLREQGSQRGLVVDARQEMSSEAARAYILKNVPDMQGLDLTGDVSCAKPYNLEAFEDYRPEAWGYWPVAREFSQIWSERGEAQAPQIAVWDFGVKRNTLRMLQAAGARVEVLPATAKAEELLQAGRSGILLSNGPGDPAAATHIIQELKKVVKASRPLFAICLGHQLVAHALGGKTYKMKFGHRGIHHPVVELDEKGQPLRTWITSQNHGFAVDADSLPKPARVSFVHGDDGTVEGIAAPELRVQTVQFHPEAAPGPTDASLLISNFVAATF